MAYLLSYLYSDISLFIMYNLRHLLLFTCKQGCLQTCKYDQSLSAMETYIPTQFWVYMWLFFELWVSNLNKEEEEKKEKKMKNSAHHSPIHIYDGEDLGHSYIQSTTVLCVILSFLFFSLNPSISETIRDTGLKFFITM